MLYLDSSALVKWYVRESGTDRAREILSTDQAWFAGAHTWTEVAIALDRRVIPQERDAALQRFRTDWGRITTVAMDGVVCARAADLGIGHRLRTLDALHLAAAERAGGADLTFVTFDARLAVAARAMGWPVAGG
ncbi:MAG: type II toxin-antitoxin system VapC family toxin [Chloroflexota bacterium]